MATKQVLKRGVWNTFAITAYTHQVGTDPRACGGVHLHQVRRGRAGWMRRTLDANGHWRSSGPVTPVPDGEGEALFERAKQA